MHDTAAHDEGKGQYLWVWLALLILTAVEVMLAYRQVFQPLRMLEVLMILSVIKSALIIGYFMHLKYEITAMKWTLMVAVSACLCLMCLFFADALRIIDLGVK
jgi:caa(3)-type oxidase subunit IV